MGLLLGEGGGGAAYEEVGAFEEEPTLDPRYAVGVFGDGWVLRPSEVSLCEVDAMVMVVVMAVVVGVASHYCRHAEESESKVGYKLHGETHLWNVSVRVKLGYREKDRLLSG